MEEVEQIKRQIATGNTEEAIKRLKVIINRLRQAVQATPSNKAQKDLAEHYVLLGNAYRKKNVFKQALDYYQSAIDLDPDSPAVEARQHLIEILNFYHKDMFNH